MNDQLTEKFTSRPFSVQPSDLARIERMANAKRLNFSALVRTIVMEEVEQWEQENNLQPLPQTAQ